MTIESLEERTLLSTTIPLNPVSWTPLGPAPIKSGQIDGDGPVSGRITGIAADPTSANVIYIATAGGGVWKTTNGGASWTPRTDDQATLSMGAIAVARSDANVIYAGTGEANNSSDSFYGRGVLKSKDGGAHWELLGTEQFDRRTISAIAIDPNNADIVYATVAGGGINGVAGNTGVWKSTHGGTEWTNTTIAISTSASFTDLVMDPTNTMVLYTAVRGKGIYKTTNGGQDWFPLAGGLPAGTSFGNTRIAMSQASSQVVYVSIESGGGLFKFMRSANAGTTWIDLTAGTPNYMRTQGWYDTTLAVDPTNPNIVYAGGAADANAVIQSTNGGQTWFDISTGADGNGLHADHHAIGFDANGRLLEGNDGGIWRLDNPNAGNIQWSNLNTNLQITTFTGIALHPTDPNIAFGGSQDNGIEMFNDSTGWTLVSLGDGGFVRVNPTNPNIVYGEHAVVNFPIVERSVGGGRRGTFCFLSNPSPQGCNVTPPRTVNDELNNSQFYPPLVLDPANGQRLLYGTDRVYESTNGGNNWSVLSTPGLNGWSNGNQPLRKRIDSVAAAASDANTIYAAAGFVFRTTDRGQTWTATDPQPTSQNFRRFADLMVDPTNSQIVYTVAADFDQTSSAHVWRTSNGGQNWTDITSNLPNLPTWTIELNSKGPGGADDILYVGTDNGVYICANIGATCNWTRFGQALPNVQVVDLELNSNLGILAAGTHGRGLWEISLADAPANDNFANPSTLTGTTAQSTGSNVGATKEAGEPSHADNVGGKSVWWSWTAPASGHVTISTAGSNFDTTLAVYTGASLDTLMVQAKGDDITAGTVQQSQVEFDAVAGTTYRIAVDGFKEQTGDTGAGSIALSLNEAGPAAPANDNFVNANTLTGTSAQTTGSNVGASKETGEPNHAGNVGGKSVWWNWTAPTAGHVTISTTGSNYDTTLAVYTGTAVAALTLQAQNDDINPGVVQQSQVEFDAVAGTNYRIAVDGFKDGAGDAASGNISLSLTETVPAPANDNFANATALNGNSVTTAGSTVGATKEPGEPNHAANAGGKSVWWNWTATGSGNVMIATSGSNFDTLLAVYTGTMVGALTPVASNDNSVASLQSGVSFEAVAGTTYRIAVDGFGGASGNIMLGITATLAGAPGNDNFAAAANLNGTSVTVGATNVGATREPGEPNHAASGGGKSVWWVWTAPAAGTVTVSTVGSSFDTALAVYTGTSVGGLSEVASNDNVGGEEVLDRTSQTTFLATAGTVYRIAVDGAGGAAGNINLALSEALTTAPANDNLANASVLTGTTTNATGSNVGASKETGEPNHAGNAGGNSVWWTWRAPTAGNVVISTAGSRFDTLLAIYTGSTVAGLTQVASNDNFGATFQSQATFTALAEATYQIAVDGSGGASGDINLSLNETPTAPANDNFTNAITLNGMSAMAHGSSFGATKETGEPNHAGNTGGKSIWWVWTATTAGNVTISTDGSDFDTLLAVYTGTSVAGLTPVASNDNFGAGLQSQVNFSASAGTTYRIAVDGSGGTSGDASLSLNETLAGPANDNFANAIALSGTSANSSGSNQGATKEMDEPNHAGNAGGASVWWTWTAPASGNVTLATTGSNFDTLLAVYTGTSVTSLTELVSNDDIASGTQVDSRVTFAAALGTTYQFAVDGYNGVSGNVSLTLNQAVSGGPANDNFANAAVLNGGSATTTATNQDATGETGEPFHASRAGGKSVWWTWTAPATGGATITTAGSNFDTLLAVYTGASVDALTEIASNDDFGDLLQSQVGFTGLAGTNYRIAVDGYFGDSGNVMLALTQTVTAAPANDNFANAAALSGNSPTATGSNIGASRETGEPDHAGNVAAKSVWWTWTAPASGPVTVSTGGSNFDTVLAAYTGMSVAALTELASNDDFAATLQSEIAFTAVAGTTYTIAVDGFAGASGNIALAVTLTAATAPANDDFVDADVLNGTSVNVTGSNQGATKEPGEPNHANRTTGTTSVWWVWTAPDSGDVVISTAGSDFDTILAVYTGSTVAALTAVTSNDDFAATLQSQVAFTAVAGTTYRVAIAGFSGSSGSIALGLTETVVTGPTNDNFASASVLSGTSATDTGSNTGATEEAGEPNHAGIVTAITSVWWNWTATDAGSVIVSTAGSDFDTVLAVYTGSSVAALTEVASNDDFDGLQSQVSFTAVAGTTYHIAVAGFLGATGDIALDLTETVVSAPATDDFDDASLLSGTSATSNASNVTATKEAGEPNHAGNTGGKSVWWVWTAPVSGRFTITTVGSNFDTLLAVYTGSNVAALTGVASNDDFSGRQSQVTFNAVASTTYHIAVDGYLAASGSISLDLAQTQVTGPANDDFASATPLIGTSLSVIGSNIGATAEPGEPNHALRPAAASAWWTWTAPTPARVTISTKKSNFDTVLAVYTGTIVTSLSEVASNDDLSRRSTQSQVTFVATAGVNYRIAVDGFQGASGFIRFKLKAKRLR